MKKLITIAIFMFIPSICFADKPEAKSKFYDFGDQVINGEIKVPKIQPVDGKQKVEFDRLLNLKKSFLSELENSGKDSVFK